MEEIDDEVDLFDYQVKNKSEHLNEPWKETCSEIALESTVKCLEVSYTSRSKNSSEMSRQIRDKH